MQKSRDVQGCCAICGPCPWIGILFIFTLLKFHFFLFFYQVFLYLFYFYTFYIFYIFYIFSIFIFFISFSIRFFYIFFETGCLCFETLSGFKLASSCLPQPPKYQNLYRSSWCHIPVYLYYLLFFFFTFLLLMCVLFLALKKS